jgi:hypothetical protein
MRAVKLRGGFFLRLWACPGVSSLEAHGHGRAAIPGDIQFASELFDKNSYQTHPQGLEVFRIDVIGQPNAAVTDLQLNPTIVQSMKQNLDSTAL